MKTCLDLAVELVEQGVGVVPIRPDSKHFFAKLCYPQCFERLPTVDEVSVWYRREPDAQLGIVAGVGDVRILDFETVQEYHRYMYLLNGLGRLKGFECLSIGLFDAIDQMPQVRTGGGGVHLYFRRPDLAQEYADLAVIQGKSAINILTSYRYAVCPPSRLIVNGTRYAYRWFRGKESFNTIPVLSHPHLEMLLDVCKLIGDSSTCESNYGVNYADWED